MSELSYPGDLTDVDELALLLSTTGLDQMSCESKARLFARAVSALSVTGESHHSLPAMAFFVPGRIEIFGKHTDYAGGRTLSAAVERGFCIVALPRDDQQMIVIDARSGDTVHFAVDAELPSQADSWANYPVTIARRVARDFPGSRRGADVAFISDLPGGAGMCSSTALMVGIFMVLSEVNQLPTRDDYWHNIGGKIDLARYLGAVENGRSFGTFPGGDDGEPFGGDEASTTIICAEPNEICQYAYCPLEFEKLLPMPSGYVFAIASSGAALDNSASACETRARPRRLVSTLVELWRERTGRDDLHLAEALGSSPDAAERLKSMIDSLDSARFDREALAARLEHFMVESGWLIPQAGEALDGGDMRLLGRLAERSQHAAERLLQNQTPETLWLVTAAKRLGAAATTSFGQGFGGSVWTLLETSKADDFLTAWADEYRDEFNDCGQAAHFFLTGAGPGAFRVC